MSAPYNAANILWHGYCQLVRLSAPLEDQQRLLGVAEWSKQNGGTLPPWAQPASPPRYDATAKLAKLEEGEDA